jgi:hypothetical protein
MWVVQNASHRRHELLGLKPGSEHGELLIKQLGWRLYRYNVDTGWCESLENGLSGMRGNVVKHLLVLANLCKFGWCYVDGRAEGGMARANGYD